MQVMILEPDRTARVAITAALKSRGFTCLPAECIELAMELLRSTAIDVLIAAHRVGGKFTFSVALAAEYYNPAIETILLTDGCGPETADYAELIPSLHCVLGRPADPDLVARFALSAAAFQITGERPKLGLNGATAPLILADCDRVPASPFIPACFRSMQGGAQAREVA